MSQSKIRTALSQFRPSAAQRWQKQSYVAALLVGLAVGACGGGGAGGGGGDVAGAKSFICPNVTGAEAIGWDFYNGVLRADPGAFPPPFPVGKTFFHSAYITLNFSYHTGWTATEIPPLNIGVVVIRDDQQALWKQEQVLATGPVSVQAARDDQITRIKQFVGQAGAQIDIVCTNVGTTPLGAQISNIMFRVGGHTAIVAAQVFTLPSSTTTAITFKAMVAPTAEFGARILDSFLAIDWQFRICTGPPNDRDNDGDPDLTDPAPCDPSINTANPFRPI